MNEKNHINKLAFPISKGCLFIGWEEISYFQSNGNNCQLIDTKCKEYHILKSLLSIEKELVELPFVRIHKSYLVNASNIREYTKSENGQILMDCGKRIIVGKSRKDSVKDFINSLTRNDFLSSLN